MGRKIKAVAASVAVAASAVLVLGAGAAAPASAATVEATSCDGLSSASNISASAYADRLIRAWGRGDRAAAGCYGTAGTVKNLFGYMQAGGPDWRQTGAEGAAGTIYVTFRDTNRGDSVIIGVQNIGNRPEPGGWHAAVSAQFG